jgi:hypothetical protein
MDDDIRSRYRMPRRDYAGPIRRHPAAGGSGSDDRPMFAPRPPAQPRPQPAPAHQPVPHHTPAHNQQTAAHRVEPAAARRHTRRKKHPFIKTLVILIILVSLAVGGWFGYQKYRVQNPFPEDIRSQSKLDLLYPVKLPAGYTINNQNMDLSNGILIYDANDKSGHRLVFTIQATPANFIFDSFYKQQLTNRQQYNTDFGSATVGKNSNRVLGSLVDDDTWLLLSTNSSDVTFNDMSLVLTHLKKY